MRLIVLCLVIVAGCAPQRDPYPVEPQSVTVHFLSESEWVEHTTERTLNGSWGKPGEIRGSARWETNEDGDITDCEIYLPADAPSRYTLSHELRHCSEGRFHK